MITHHLPGLYPALQRVQGLLIDTHIREVVVDLRKDMESKALARKADKEKWITNLLGSNLTYLLCLGQVAAHKDLPPYGRNS